MKTILIIILILLSSTTYAEEFTFVWGASDGADGYKLFCNGVEILDIITTSAKINLCFTVRAYNKAGESKDSNRVCLSFYDIDGDGDVDAIDLMMFYLRFNKFCEHFGQQIK